MTDECPGDASAGPPLTRLLDGEGRISVDLPCIHCRYNLRTLSEGSACPECGQTVAESIGFYLRPSAAWLAAVVAGANLLTMGSAVVAICAGLLASGALWLGNWDAFFSGFALLALAIILVWLIGLFRFTTPESTGRIVVRDGLSARRVIRLCLVLVPAGFIVGQPFASLFPMLSAGMLFAPDLIAALSLVVLPAALCRHVACLMARTCRPGQARLAKGMFRWILFADLVMIGAAAVGQVKGSDLAIRLGEVACLAIIGASYVLLLCASRALAAMQRQVEDLVPPNAKEPPTRAALNDRSPSDYERT